MVVVELSSLFNMKSPSFVLTAYEDFVEVVVHSRNSIKSFFYSWRNEFIVGIEVHGTWIAAIEISY